MYLINYKSRAIVNYFIVVFLFFSEYYNFLSELACLINLVFASALLVLTSITNYKYSIIKLIPIALSNKIELIIAVLFSVTFAFTLPSLRIFDIPFYISLGSILLLIRIVTDNKSQNIFIDNIN